MSVKRTGYDFLKIQGFENLTLNRIYPHSNKSTQRGYKTQDYCQSNGNLKNIKFLQKQTRKRPELWLRSHLLIGIFVV